MGEKGTKELILDTAERLFAKKGIKETSIRDITGAAGVHLAAVNYHFGSKEGLIRAVITRRLEPLNQERLRLLDTYEAEAGDAPVPLETILYALFTPAIKLSLNHPEFMCLAGRMLSGPGEGFRGLLLSQFEEVLIRFKTALIRALPSLPEVELLWRMHFLVGAMIHTYTNHSIVESFSGGLCSLANGQEAVERLITFCAAGLRAPLSVKSEGNHEGLQTSQKRG